MTLGKGTASFLAMAKLKQTAQPKNLITKINMKGGAPNRLIDLPLHSSFSQLSK